MKKTNQKKNESKIPERGKLKSLYQRNRPRYDATIHKLNRRLRSLLTKNGINNTIKFRVKSFDSYFSKLRKLYKTSAPLITDVIGLRVILPFLEDLEHAHQLIAEHFKVVDIERKGSIHSFREFGYDSLHLLIDCSQERIPDNLPNVPQVCEIQLRTILQEAWAEVEHELIYKADFSLLNDSIKRKLASLNATLTLSDIIFQEIRDFQKEVQAWGNKRKEHLQEKVLDLEGVTALSTKLAKDTVDDTGVKSTKIVHKNPLEKMIFEALNAHSNNQYKQAIELYTKILNMRPQPQTRSVVYNHRGMVYFVLSEYRKAIHDFAKAIKYDSQNCQAYSNRGLCYRIVQNYKRALDDFNRSIAIDEYQKEGYYNRALTYYDIHDYTNALADCEKTLNLEPNFVPAKHLRKMIRVKIFGQ